MRRSTLTAKSKASIWGTGTEDYFLSAWGLKTTSTPYFGTPYFDQWGIVGGHTSAYRWHIQDPIVFQKSIKVTIEHFGWISTDENPRGERDSWNEREDDFASVAFWYQTGEPTPAEPVPDAAGRTLPNLDIRPAARGIHGRRSPRSRASASCRTISRSIRRDSCSTSRQQAADAWVEIPFQVRSANRAACCWPSPAPAITASIRPYLNGVQIGPPLDLYARDVSEWEYPPAGLLA